MAFNLFYWHGLKEDKIPFQGLTKAAFVFPIIKKMFMIKKSWVIIFLSLWSLNANAFDNPKKPTKATNLKNGSIF